MDIVVMITIMWSLSITKEYVSAYGMTGKEFVLSFNFQTSATIEDLFFVVINNGKQDTEVFVNTSKSFTYLNQNFKVSAGQSTEVKIDSNLQLSYIGKEEKGIKIQSLFDVTIVAYQRIKYSNDAFMVYPTNRLGVIYFAVTHCESTRMCTVSVVASQNNTSVTIFLPTSPGLNILYNGDIYTSGDVIAAELDNYETFLIKDDIDLSGTRVISDKPVVVYSGNDRSSLHFSYIDHFSDQVPPAYLLGKIYMINNADFKSIHYIKIITTMPETNITISADVEETLYLANMSDILMRNFNSKMVTVEASNPIAIAHFVFDSKGNTAMYFVTCLERYDVIYDIYGIGTFFDSSSFYYINYVVICIEEGYENGLMIDGVFIVPTQAWTVKTIGNSTFASAIFQISTGSHVIKHQWGNITFGGYVVGVGDSEIYTTSLGAKLNDVGVTEEKYELSAWITSSSMNNADDDLLTSQEFLFPSTSRQWVQSEFGDSYDLLMDASANMQISTPLLVTSISMNTLLPASSLLTVNVTTSSPYLSHTQLVDFSYTSSADLSGTYIHWSDKNSVTISEIYTSTAPDFQTSTVIEMSTHTISIQEIYASTSSLNEDQQSSSNKILPHLTTAPNTEYDNTSSTVQCKCRCDVTASHVTNSDFNKSIILLQNKLRINKTNLSSYHRKLTSADDNRMSARYMGYVGVFILTFVTGTIVIPDLVSLGRYLRSTHYRIQR